MLAWKAMTEPTDPTTNKTISPDAELVSAADQILEVQFLELHRHERVRMLRLLHQWDQAPRKRRALALRLLNSQLSADLVASLCGVSTRQLRRYREFRAATQLAREQGSPLPRGAKGRDGEMEAWEEEE